MKKFLFMTTTIIIAVAVTALLAPAAAETNE